MPFTPAPWAIAEGPGHDGATRYFIVSGRHRVAEISTGEENAANAALIQAAPAMFKALEDLLIDAQFYRVWPADHFCIRQAQAALTSAVRLP